MVSQNVKGRWHQPLMVMRYPSRPTVLRLDTEVKIYDLSESVRAVVDWDGAKKVARLVVGLTSQQLDSQAVSNCLALRQEVEITIKSLLRRVKLAHFCGGKALIEEAEPRSRSASQVEKWPKNLKQVKTRGQNSRARLAEVEKELQSLKDKPNSKPSNSLGLGRQDLNSLAKKLTSQVERAEARIKELEQLLAWANGESAAPSQKQVASLDLTGEAILTQMKLDVFTAQETLINEFIEIGLKPVLRKEAERQAASRAAVAKCSTAKGKEGQPLCTDAVKLYESKVESLQRETILHRLLSQPGEFVRHQDKRLILCVFQRFRDKRTQAAFEHYARFLNQQQIRLPLDEGPAWKLLFTYHETVE